MSWLKNQFKLNLFLDAIMFVLLMAMAGFGFLIKYVLVPGFQRNVVYGYGFELELWGLNRHQWGTIHLVVSLFFLLLLLLHIAFHWKMIGCFCSQIIPNRRVRIPITILFSFLLVLLLVGPLFLTPERTVFNHLHRNHRPQQNLFPEAQLRETMDRQRKEMVFPETVSGESDAAKASIPTRERHFNNQSETGRYNQGVRRLQRKRLAH